MNLNLNEVTCFLPFNKDFYDVANKTEIQAINPNHNESLMTIKNFSPHYKFLSTNVFYIQNWDNWTRDSMRCLKLVDSDKWNYSQDFTIQFWFYAVHGRNEYNASGMPGGGYSNSLFSLEPNAYFGIISRDNKIIVHIGNGASWSYSIGRNNVISPNDIFTKQWYHFALVKKGNIVCYYINGIKKAEATVTNINWNFGKMAYIGKWGSYNNNTGDTTASFGGEFCMTEFMVDLGHAWYTDNFTPQSLLNNNMMNTLKLGE